MEPVGGVDSSNVSHARTTPPPPPTQLLSQTRQQQGVRLFYTVPI